MHVFLFANWCVSSVSERVFIVFSIKANLVQLLTLEEVPEDDCANIAFKPLLTGCSVPTLKMASIATAGKPSMHPIASSKASSPQTAI